MKSKCPICNKRLKKNKQLGCWQCKHRKGKIIPRHLFRINKKVPTRFYLVFNDYMVKPFTENPEKKSHFIVYKQDSITKIFKGITTCPEFEIKSIQQLINKLETIATFS